MAESSQEQTTQSEAENEQGKQSKQEKMETLSARDLLEYLTKEKVEKRRK